MKPLFLKKIISQVHTNLTYNNVIVKNDLFTSFQEQTVLIVQNILVNGINKIYLLV